MRSQRRRLRTQAIRCGCLPLPHSSPHPAEYSLIPATSFGIVATRNVRSPACFPQRHHAAGALSAILTSQARCGVSPRVRRFLNFIVWQPPRIRAEACHQNPHLPRPTSPRVAAHAASRRVCHTHTNTGAAGGSRASGASSGSVNTRPSRHARRPDRLPPRRALACSKTRSFRNNNTNEK